MEKNKSFESFKWINEEFLRLYAEFDDRRDGRFDDYLHQTIMELQEYSYEEENPQEALQKFARCLAFSDERTLCRSLSAFRYMFHIPDDHCYAQYKPFVDQYLQERSSEEWLLLIFEEYFWAGVKGGKYLSKMKINGLFHGHLNVLFKMSKDLCNRYRELPKNPMRERLEDLFSKINMSQITLRETKVKFKNSILPAYKEVLCEKAYKYLGHCVDQIEAPCWKGNWIIYDISLFADDLLENYESQIKNVNKSRQERDADYIFIITLCYLINGDLTEYKMISEIPFSENFRKIERLL